MGLTEFLHDPLEWIQQSGWIGVVWFIVLYTLTCVFFLPGSILTVGAGAVYGFWFSTALVTISSTVGAAVNFLTSRYLARSWMQRSRTHSNLVLEVHPRILCRVSPNQRSLYLRRSHGRQGLAHKRRCGTARPCHMGVLLPRSRRDVGSHGSYDEDFPAEFEDLSRRNTTGRRTAAGVDQP